MVPPVTAGVSAQLTGVLDDVSWRANGALAATYKFPAPGPTVKVSGSMLRLARTDRETLPVESETSVKKPPKYCEVGIPVIAPVALLRFNPAGREDPTEIDHAYGAMPPAAWSCPPYARPTVPFGKSTVGGNVVEAPTIVRGCSTESTRSAVAKSGGVEESYA